VIQVRIGYLFFLFRAKRIPISMEFHQSTTSLQPEWKLKILGKQLCPMSGLFIWSTSATVKAHDQQENDWDEHPVLAFHYHTASFQLDPNQEYQQNC
jgi:hypothetical protein